MVKKRIEEIQRKRNTQTIRKNVYISCEGETEEAYLKGLKKRFKDVATIKISNSNRTAAKDVVKNLKNKYSKEYDKSDLKYCVFDCDDNSQNDINEALKLAEKEHARVIFSNPCFEIWLLWHFKNDFSFQNSNDNLKREIEKLLKPNYWTYKNNPTLYDLLESKRSNAQMNHVHRKSQLERDNIPQYSRESNPFSNMDDLLSDLIQLHNQ